MQRFITHDPVAAGWFNLGKSSVTPGMSQWEGELQNTEAVLELMLDRMLADYEALHVKMRKPWVSKDVETCQVFRFSNQREEALQRSCCAFMAFERTYRSTVPADFAKAEFDGIKKAFHGYRIYHHYVHLRFLLRHLDQELNRALETAVPPPDLMAISAFRASVQKHAKKAAGVRVAPQLA